MKLLSKNSVCLLLCASLLTSTQLPGGLLPVYAQGSKWMAIDAKPSFGITTKNVVSEEGVRGVLVEKVNNPVSQLRVGDVILSVEEKEISTDESLKSLLAQKEIGALVKAKINRDGKDVSIMLTVLGEEEGTKVTSAEKQPGSEASGNKYKLGSGTALKLVLEETVSSNKSKKNDSVNYSVQEDVKGPNGAILIRKGAKAGGTITMAKGAGGFGRKGKLEFTAEWVETVDGQRAVLRTSQQANGKGQQGVAVATFLFLSVLGGFIKGKNATVNKGTVIPAFVDRDIDIASATS